MDKLKEYKSIFSNSCDRKVYDLLNNIIKEGDTIEFLTLNIKEEYEKI